MKEVKGQELRKRKSTKENIILSTGVNNQAIKDFVLYVDQFKHYWKSLLTTQLSPMNHL